jgi:hypothetical protein
LDVVQGYFVLAEGLNKEMVRAYIRQQEKDNGHYDQMKLGLIVLGELWVASDFESL